MADEINLEFGSETPQAPTIDDALAKTEQPAVPAAPSAIDDSILSAEEKQQVKNFVQKIDIADSSAVLSYGVGAQRKVADFSQKALDNVRTKDLSEVGEELSTLVVQLGNLDPGEEEQGGLLGLFKRGKNKAESLKARYSSVETNVNAISNQLENHQVQLLKDIDLLDRMYDLNQQYFKELTMYVIAGKEKLEQVRATDLPAVRKKAEESGKPEDAQAARDLAARCDRFEKRVYDLELTRQVALQTAPQIRMVQASDAVMAEKIQTTVVNTIPLWKNQMVIALGVEHATRAATAQRQVTDMTNELLKKNADSLKVATVEAAKESERGIVDIETLRHTNEQLIGTLDEVMQVQREGREKRLAAEAELSAIEGQLKQKLLEASKE
ncbi:toxic anion resistance protein [Curtanaerobium respiraculi]|uniref:toxic anion resistance protein n=1 Tax=Curtanaerobium respiraculi TaxID=2949669 RepID=UPI0024B37407|nr:toxic anion resistance protein [Curtanaerobium respiraculi]